MGEILIFKKEEEQDKMSSSFLKKIRNSSRFRLKNKEYIPVDIFIVIAIVIKLTMLGYVCNCNIVFSWSGVETVTKRYNNIIK